MGIYQTIKPAILSDHAVLHKVMHHNSRTSQVRTGVYRDLFMSFYSWLLLVGLGGSFDKTGVFPGKPAFKYIESLQLASQRWRCTQDHSLMF